MKTTLYFRKKPLDAHSVERLFETLIAQMPPDVEIRRAQSRYGGANPLKCLYNALEAIGRQGEVNHLTGDNYYVAGFLKGSRTVTTVLDCVNLTRLQGFKREVFRRFWYDIPVRRSRVVTTISEFTRQELLSYVRCDPEKVKVIYVPIGPEFAAKPKRLDFDRPTILMFGSAWNKNHARQAEALAGIPCVLNLVGHPSPEMRAIVEKHGIEHRFESELSGAEVLERYAQCDLVMFASLYEGFGMPIVEGNAVGRPVITGKAASMPEVAGDAAVIVDPESVEDIRAAVLRLRDEPAYRDALVENGHRNVERFSAARIAEQFAEIYRDLA